MAGWRYYMLLGRYVALLFFKHKTIGKTAEAMADRFGDAPFLLFEGEVQSFRAFNAAANRRAHVLRGLGIAKGDVVALLMENRPEYVAWLVAMGKLGAITATINHHLRGQALRDTIELAPARKIIVGAECLPALLQVLPSLGRLAARDVYIDTRWPAEALPPAGSHDLHALLARALADNPPRPALNSLAPLLYIFTSGTTGLPKAARISHLRWHAAALAMGSYALRLGARDTVYCALPLYHSNGSLVAFGSALGNGVRLAIARRFSASRFWEEVTRCQATCFIYIGELLRYLLSTPPGPYDRAHRVTRILGNGLRADIWGAFMGRFGVATIREFYASTEGNAATINMDNVVGSVGTPLLKMRDNLAVVRFDFATGEYARGPDGFLQRCAADEVGELLGEIRATMPFHGYTSRRDTEQKILRDVFRPGDAHFRTGDLVRKDGDGYFYFVDRVGDTFRWKGENVSTQQVQEVLSQFDGVTMVNVVGVEIPHSEGRAGLAALIMRKGLAFDPAAFHAFVCESLPAYARPAFVRLLQDMELTGTFKLKKTDLKTQGYDPAQVADTVYYRDDSAGTYTLLDAATVQHVGIGRIRF